MKKMVWIATGLLCLNLAAFADDKKPAAPTADQKAAMDAMMKAMQPGEMHKKMNAFVGTFDAKVTSRMDPAGPATETAGTSVNTWVLDGRFVEQKFSGSYMGMPFNGIGYTGYDNVKKSYFGTWMDNMSTSVMVSSGGRMDGNAMTLDSTVDDPMTGKPQQIKEKITVADNDHHTLEMWGPAPDGTMFKMMEIAYTRKK